MILATATAALGVPKPATASPLASLARPLALMAPSLSPDSAEGKREAIRDAAKDDIEAENYAAAADTLAENAALLGDPVTYMEAAELHLQQADKDRDPAQCEAAIEVATIALDILHFYDAVAKGDASSSWKVIDPGDAAGMITETEAIIEKAEALIETIEEEKAAAAAAAESGDGGAPAGPVDQPKKEKKPGTGLIVGGAVAATVGVAGVSMAIAGLVISRGKQKEVEELMRPADDDEIAAIDEEGKQANLIAFIGAGIGAVGLAVGVPLLIVGAKKRKQGATTAATSLRVAPALTRTSSGLSLSGRF